MPYSTTPTPTPTSSRGSSRGCRCRSRCCGMQSLSFCRSVGLSVGLSVNNERVHTGTVEKPLIGSRCRLGWIRWATCIRFRWESDPPRQSANFGEWGGVNYLRNITDRENTASVVQKKHSGDAALCQITFCGISCSLIIITCDNMIVKQLATWTL